MSEVRQQSALKVALGFGLGLIGGALCFAITVVVGLTFQSRHGWVFPLLNAIALMLAGIIALRNYNESGVARGAVIALSLVFLLNAICGIAFMH